MKKKKPVVRLVSKEPPTGLMRVEWITDFNDREVDAIIGHARKCLGGGCLCEFISPWPFASKAKRIGWRLLRVASISDSESILDAWHVDANTGYFSRGVFVT